MDTPRGGPETGRRYIEIIRPRSHPSPEKQEKTEMPISHRKPIARQLDLTLTEEQRSLIQICLEIAIDKFEANAIAAHGHGEASLNAQFNRQHEQAADLMEQFGAAGAVILTPDKCA
jgi:hypothetical protein